MAEFEAAYITSGLDEMLGVECEECVRSWEVRSTDRAKAEESLVRHVRTYHPEYEIHPERH